MNDTSHDTLIDIAIAAGGPSGSTGNGVAMYDRAALADLVARRHIRILDNGIVVATMSGSVFDALMDGV